MVARAFQTGAAMRKIDRNTQLPTALMACPAGRLGISARLAATAATIVEAVRDWRERERQRREMSQMSQRDFGDIAVPPAAIADEIRRWPWQRIVLPARDQRQPGNGRGGSRPAEGPRDVDTLQCLSPFAVAPPLLHRSNAQEAAASGERPARELLPLAE